jgi:uncharacterized membrane protein YeaQ/YmgE (transglycosylase-associated protein family)
MFHLAGQLFFGLIVGILAKLINPGKARIGVIAMALIGLAGSVVGTIIGHVGFTHHQAAGWILSIAGAIASLCIYYFSTRARIHRESTAATGESKHPL